MLAASHSPGAELSARRKLIVSAIVACGFAAYVWTFPQYYPRAGDTAAILGVPLALITAWSCGLRAGLGVASLLLVTNTIMVFSLTGSWWSLAQSDEGVLGHLAMFATTAMIGRLHDMGRLLSATAREQRDARQEAERAHEESSKARVEASLLRTDRMASVGTLAAGVAHEINNPLTYVLANLRCLEEGIDELPHLAREQRDDLFTLLHDAVEGAERVRRIVRDLKTFARAEEESEVTGPVDLGAAADAAVNLVHNELRHRAVLVRDDDEIAPAMAYESRVVQVLVNLLVNAAQAMPEDADSDRTIRITTRQLPDKVQITVADTGEGIAPELMPHIFDPFFTTKPVGVGTGLGLSIAHSIVMDMGGSLDVRSDPGAGSAFTVTLPRAEVTAAPKPARTSHISELRRRRVLVIDDEPLVGMSLRRILRHHDVEVVEGGLQGLERLKARHYDVILCDLMMPDLNGMDVFQQAVERQPSLRERFIFITGGVFLPRARAFVEQTENQCLEKPLEAGRIDAAITRVLRHLGEDTGSHSRRAQV